MSRQRRVSEQKLRKRINYLIAAMIATMCGFAIYGFNETYVPLLKSLM